MNGLKGQHRETHYEITAPDVIHVLEQQPFIVQGQFFGADEKPFRGEDLFVQCFLVGKGPLKGRYHRFIMQDNGSHPDVKSNDGIYTCIFHFDAEKDQGYWMIYVVAQDVNNAQPNMTPEEAAQIIGGMISTHQLTISFQGGTCPFVPDGYVHVI
jgi:hypothetical protein